ncbi:MAG: PKD domain-containing protein [Acidobacteriota bacterium]
MPVDEAAPRRESRETRRSRATKYIIPVAFIVLHLLTAACNDVPFLADKDATLMLVSNKTYLRTNGDVAQITITGYSSTWEALRDGTLVTLTATLGSVTPRVELHEGHAVASFVSGAERGQAKVTARSGAASAEITIDIEYSALAQVTLKAKPTSLPPSGGPVEIRATVSDGHGNPFSFVPVTFSTTAGTFEEAQTINTSALGVAVNHLNTTESADVTASSMGQSATVRIEVTPNIPPTASFTFWPATPKIGETVLFDASASTDSDGTIKKYSWSFSDGYKTEGREISRTFSRAATYDANLQVTDDHGDTSAITTKSITVLDYQAPDASFTYTPASPTVNGAVTFDGSASSDPDGQIERWRWDFGDGARSEGEVTTHAYRNAGVFSVQLTVVDNDGKEDETSQAVTVGDNQPPVAGFSYTPSNPVVNGDVRFDGSSSSDPDGTIQRWEWDFGDGAKGQGEAETHSYKYAGVFYARLTVTDNGGKKDETTQTITVHANQPPTASFSYVQSTDVPTQFDFNGSASYDTDGYIVSYAWDFGDGSAPVTLSGTSVTHTFPALGTYTVRLVVTDNLGAKGDTGKDVVVQ